MSRFQLNGTVNLPVDAPRWCGYIENDDDFVSLLNMEEHLRGLHGQSVSITVESNDTVSPSSVLRGTTLASVEAAVKECLS